MREGGGPGGRPSKFKDEFCAQGSKLAALGATDREIADFFEVTESTLYLWKNTHPEFSEALKTGKGPADNRVEQSLYRRATGYTYDAEKIFQYEGTPVRVDYVEHVAPDVTACIFWLKNRRPEEWREKSEVDLNVTDLAAAIEEGRKRAHGDQG